MTQPSAAARDWLTRLVALDTTSRESNLPLIDAIAEHARTFGLEPRVFPTPDGRKANMVVTIPDAAGAVSGGVMLSGHTDCVPVDGQAWASDPFEVVERDGRLYGRGTADMKGFLACVLAALPDFVGRPLARPLHLAFSYDEEVGCIGAEPLVASLREAGIVPEMGFVGEPSMMRMIAGHKSVNLIRVIVTGRSAHSSLTDHGVNAIEYGAEIVRYWRAMADRWRTEGPFDDAYPLAYSSASVNTIVGGSAVNIVPDRCEMVLECRTLPGVVDMPAEVERLREFCSEVERRMKAENAEASVVVEVEAMTVGLDVPDDSPVIALGRQLGLELSPGKVTYGTEAGVYTESGFPCVVCGPGDIAVAHRPDEYVELTQLAECEAFLARLVAQLRA